MSNWSWCFTFTTCRTFHSVFKTWIPSLSTSTPIDDMFKAIGGNQLKIVVIDEVSMLSTQFLVLLDSRLRAMYNPEQPFGGISIMLLGNFIQLPVVTGRDLWSIMYGNVNGDDATAQNLFQQFHIHELKTNMRAAECKTHTQRIQAFHALPPKYPSGRKCSAIDNEN